MSYTNKPDSLFNENIADLLTEGLVITCQEGYVKYSNKHFNQLLDHIDCQNTLLSEIIPFSRDFIRNTEKSEVEINCKVKNKHSILQVKKDLLKNPDTGENNQIFLFKDITQSRKLEEKVTGLNSFIYKVSHDLKAPLSSMSGIINLINLDPNNNSTQEYVELLHKQIKRMNCILVDLLELSRVSSEKFEKSEINLSNLTYEIIDSVGHLPNSEHLKIYTNIPPSLVINIEKTLISSVLQNLIINAINYHNLRSEDPNICINADLEGSILKIKIADNGPGISPELHDKIFDKFFRGNTNAEGSGLGLYIVKNIISKMNGEIVMESCRHSGTTFSISLPVSAK
ncbi:HAMP domain-containing sensor histidine kinase [Cytophagaceae bacterium ABcell3]|nr:HAMP domain-containing sensor histidine kinase [Cytophagaceae bacterium ABcell3]